MATFLSSVWTPSMYEKHAPDSGEAVVYCRHSGEEKVLLDTIM